MPCPSFIPITNASCARVLLAVSQLKKFDDADNVIETHEHKGEFKEW